MKKYILILLIGLFVCFSPNKVKALEREPYNLIDINKISYDEKSDVFYSPQLIKLSKNEKYTIVTSRNFLGSIYEDETNTLLNDELGTIFTDVDNNNIDIHVELKSVSTGLFYSTIITTEECYLEFTDFLTRGYKIDNLPKTEITMFKGDKEKFKGFVEGEYIDDYAKIDNVITFYTSYTNLLDIDDITNKIKCYDNETGFNNNIELISNNYQNNKAIGEYEVLYKAIDSNNNESILTVNINVVDNVSPVIEGPDLIEWDCYEQAPVPELIIRQYTAYDEIDGDISNKIRISKTSLTMYMLGKTKNYDVYLEVYDNAGNVTTKKVIVRASDITPPNLVLTDVTVNLSKLGESVFDNFFEQAIVDVEDNSGKYYIEIDSQEIINDIGFSGEYEVVIKAKDEAGNETIKTVIFKIIDDIAPEFYIHVDLLTTNTKEIKSIDEIKAKISDNLHQDGILFDSIKLISCDYFSNEKTPGEYKVKYAYSYRGEVNYVVGTINVVKAPIPPYLFIIGTGIIMVLVSVIFVKVKKRRS